MAQKPRKTRSDDMLKSKIMISSYENVTVKCPYCDKVNKYNRVTDLKTVEPIANMEVTCQNLVCANKFRIYCDNINPKYEQLIFQCEF